MRYFANPSTPSVRAAMSAGLIDCITTPVQGNLTPDGAWFCADNGCFGKGYPGDEEWLAWLQTKPLERCRFATAPDVVGDAAATLVRSRPWLPKIRALGVPAAFVAQNGIEHTVVPWNEFDVLFIGGTQECLPCGYTRPIDAPKPPRNHKARCPHCNLPVTEWKLGEVARHLIAEAKHHGKEVHMGRVNSKMRFDYAASIGCDSVDGTYVSFGPDINLPKLLGWLENQEAA